MNELNAYRNKIDEIISEATEKRTFSLEIIEKIKEMKDNFSLIEIENDNLKDIRDLFAKENSEVKNKLTDLTKKYEDLLKKKSDIEDRENKLNIADEKSAGIVRERDLVIRMFETVFRNPVIQKSSFSNGMPYRDNNGNMMSANINTTETEEVNKK